VSGLARSSELHTVTAASEAVRTSCKALVRFDLMAKTGSREGLSQALIVTGTGADQIATVESDPAFSLCALDDALESLAQIDPRRAKVIELRFFGGFSVEETAEVLQVSPQTVMRDWRIARAWLARELRDSGSSDR
jgi:RNA polymerase sigma factor (TIGR02999 family)